MSSSSTASPDKLISVCLKRQHQSFYFLCDPSVTPEYLKQQVQAALHPTTAASAGTASASTIPSTNHMRIVSPDQDATPLQDDVSLEEQNIKNQAVLHLIFGKPVSKESEFGEQDDENDEDGAAEEEEMEWEEPNVVSYSLQESARPKE